MNGKIITKERACGWIIDFPPDMTLDAAAGYGAPFEYIKIHVYPVRAKNRRRSRAERWWIHGDPQKSMREVLSPLEKYVCTPRVSKHRLFVFLGQEVLADSATVAFASCSPWLLGLLHSRLHEIWARAQGTQVRERESGFRYTPNSCFETFPFPKPSKKQKSVVAHLSKELDHLRNNWLNPPEWTREEVLEFPGSVDGPWARYIDPGPHPRPLSRERERGAVGTVRYPRIVPRDAECAKELKKRTLTNLYNERPTWLDLAHRKLDEAVFAAYGWDPGISDDELLAKLLDLNLAREAEQ
ncbi:MAG: type IIL restriction-modification enzyme MmeI [Planctomycetota bacterium]